MYYFGQMVTLSLVTDGYILLLWQTVMSSYTHDCRFEVMLMSKMIKESYSLVQMYIHGASTLSDKCTEITKRWAPR